MIYWIPGAHLGLSEDSGKKKHGKSHGSSTVSQAKKQKKGAQCSDKPK